MKTLIAAAEPPERPNTAAGVYFTGWAPVNTAAAAYLPPPVLVYPHSGAVTLWPALPTIPGCAGNANTVWWTPDGP